MNGDRPETEGPAAAGQVSQRVRNRHVAIIFMIIGLGGVIGGGSAVLLNLVLNPEFTFVQYYSIGCMGFLLAWWIVYFNYQVFGVYNLRAFLRDKNPYRDEARVGALGESGSDDADTNIVTKAAFSIGAQGILIAIIVFFLDLVLNTADPDEFQDFLRPIIVGLGLLAILLMVFAIDILDTAANVFASGERSPREYRRWFNSGVGPGFPKGGAAYAYLGFACFSAYIVLGLSFFYPLITGFGISVYAYLGYPFLFGYVQVRRVDGTTAIEVDDAPSWSPHVLGGMLLSVTALVAVLA